MYKFKAVVNPFTRKVILTSTIAEVPYGLTMHYEDIDEWNGFNMGDNIFDIHFDYEDKFYVSIYSVIDNKADVERSHEVDVVILIQDTVSDEL